MYKYVIKTGISPHVIETFISPRCISYYEHRHNQKCYWTSENEKQVPFSKVLLPQTKVWNLCNNKKLLHDIFHIGPGISPRLPYQARQRSWRADIGRGLIPGTIWKISCHNLLITYFTLTFSKHWHLYCKRIVELTNCENKSLRDLPLFNFESGFKNIRNNVDLYNDIRNCL